VGALAAVVLQIFALQVFVHFAASDVEGATAVRIYIAIYAITYLALTALVAIGLRVRSSELSLPRASKWCPKIDWLWNHHRRIRDLVGPRLERERFFYDHARICGLPHVRPSRASVATRGHHSRTTRRGLGIKANTC